jgi:hypothetical protein
MCIYIALAPRMRHDRGTRDDQPSAQEDLNDEEAVKKLEFERNETTPKGMGRLEKL